MSDMGALDTVAYHGTERMKATSIVESGKFQTSFGNRHYIGEGIYFAGTPGDCKAILGDRCEEIVKCRIVSQRVLDLDNRAIYEMCRQAFIKWRARSPDRSISLGMVVNTLCNGLDNVEVVIKMFPDTRSAERVWVRELSPQGPLLSMRYIVVRAHHCIVDLELMAV